MKIRRMTTIESQEKEKGKPSGVRQVPPEVFLVQNGCLKEILINSLVLC